MATDGRRHILAMGGLRSPLSQREPLPALIAHALSLSGAATPRVCVLNTANGDDPVSYQKFYAILSQNGARVSHLQLFAMPNVDDPEDLLLSQDVIFVGGVSAGAICWFEGGTTDSFGPVLRPFTAGLGLLSGSYCPHYDSEPTRRPTYQSLVAEGTLAAGVACDDGAAAHFTDSGFTAIVSVRDGATGYLVEPDGSGGSTERPLKPVMI